MKQGLRKPSFVSRVRLELLIGGLQLRNTIFGSKYSCRTLDLITTQKAQLRDDCEKIETELMLNNLRTNFI
jgi:hypothetical protein